MVSLCLSLIIFYALFLFGVNNHKHVAEYKLQEANVIPASDEHTERDRGPCTAVTALLQYFLMATFTCNALYGAYTTMVLRNSLIHAPHYLPALGVVTGWGLPGVIVALTLAVSYRVDRPLGYRREEL